MLSRLRSNDDVDALLDPPEPWEGPGDEDDLRAYTARRLSAYAHRPRSPKDVPVGALEALNGVLGRLTGEDLVVIPRTPRPVGVGPSQWVVTPASVVGIGDKALALWVDRPGPGLVTVIGFDDVAAITDRTILLLGRLEIRGAERSIVVRYNTVGRELMRTALVEIRHAFWPPGLPFAATGVRPEQLPHKWMALLRSADMLPNGPDGQLIAAGNLDDPRQRHNGVAALSSTELLIATEPETGAGTSHYGVDLVVLPRPRLTRLTTGRASVTATVRVAGRLVETAVAVSPSLAATIEATLVPAVATS